MLSVFSVQFYVFPVCFENSEGGSHSICMCMTHTRKCNKKITNRTRRHRGLLCDSFATACDLLETEEVAICIMTHSVRVTSNENKNKP